MLEMDIISINGFELGEEVGGLGGLGT